MNLYLIGGFSGLIFAASAFVFFIIATGDVPMHEHSQTDYKVWRVVGIIMCISFAIFAPCYILTNSFQ